MRTLVIVTVVLSLGLVTLTVLGVLAYLDLRDRGDIEDRLAGADLRMEDFGKGLYQLENSVAGLTSRVLFVMVPIRERSSSAIRENIK